ncbi:MAG: hypothetical protein IJ678_00910, partial [Kiritimatiellae bacterium]|nr:hypothetical protein [Kiritimatiellia bacterium]
MSKKRYFWRNFHSCFAEVAVIFFVAKEGGGLSCPRREFATPQHSMLVMKRQFRNIRFGNATRAGLRAAAF